MSLDTIITIAWVLMGAFAVGVIGYILWYRLLRPKAVLKNSKPTDHSGLPRKDATQLIPVKEIKDGSVRLDGEYRFIRSMRTTGNDLFLAETNDQLQTEADYRQFFRTIQYPITFRIDSSSCDLTLSIAEHKDALQRLETEYGEAVSQFAMLEQLFQDAKTDIEKHDILYEMYNSDRHVTAYENMIRHLRQQIEFLEAHSGGQSNPVIEQRYIYEWSYNPDDFPQNEDVINQKAENELAAIERTMKNALLSAGVKATVDDDKALFALSYRHYHPYAGRIYKDHDQTDFEEKLNRGKAYYDINEKKYRTIKKDPIIIEAFDKIEKEKKEKAEKEALEYKKRAEEEGNDDEDARPEVKPAKAASMEKNTAYELEEDEEGGIEL